MDNNMEWHCNQIDCLLHPVSIKKEMERKEKVASNNLSSSNSLSATFNVSYTNNLGPMVINNKNDDEDLVLEFELPYLNHRIPIQCIICKHMNKYDMKEEIIVKKAKNSLEEE